MEFILLIIKVVTWLLGVINSFPSVVSTDIVPLATSQWHCEDTYWAESPMVIGGVFHGKLRMDCEMEGIDGGGLIELRRHMVEKIPSLTEKVHGSPTVENFEGLPALAFDITLKAQNEMEESLFRGTTHIATNGFTKLRNVFVATHIPTSGNSKYLRDLQTEISVSPMERPGWYKLSVISQPTVFKPSFMSAYRFKRILVKGAEDGMVERVENLVTNYANHL